MNIKNISVELYRANEKQYKLVALSSVFIIIIFWFNLGTNNSGEAFKIVKDLAEKGLNLFIFLPSLTFVVLGLFPSFSNDLKLKLMSPALETEGELEIKIFLNQFVFILLWSLVLIAMSFLIYLLLSFEMKIKIFPNASKIIGCVFVSLFLFFYLYLVQILFFELGRCVRLIYNLILGDYANNFKKYKKNNK